MRSAARKDHARALLERQGRKFFNALPLALAGDKDSIHDLRVAGRRLRIAVRILAASPEGRHAQRVDRLLRDLIRTAGACRDQDVSIALLEEDVTSGSRHPAESARLLRRLRAARALSRHRMTEDLLDLDLRALRKALRGVIERAKKEEPDALPQALEHAAEVAGEAGGEINTLLTGLNGRYDAARLHTVRTRLRRLRYAAEITEEIGGATALRSTDLSEAQDRLGTLHDTHVLAAWLGEQAKRGDALAPAAGSLSRRFQRKSREAHKFFQEGAPLQLVNETRATIESAGRGAK